MSNNTRTVSAKKKQVRFYSSYVNFTVLEKSMRAETIDEFTNRWGITVAQFENLADYISLEDLYIKISLLGILDVEEFLKDVFEKPRKFKGDYWCKLLKQQSKITFPSFIEKIGSCWLYNINQKTSIIIPKNIRLVESGNLSNINETVSIKINKGVEAFGSRCFSNLYVKNIHIKFPETVKYIGTFCFTDNEYLPEVTMPKNIECGKNVFCNHFKGWKITNIKDKYELNYV